jgi:hypothetical protein
VEITGTDDNGIKIKDRRMISDVGMLNIAEEITVNHDISRTNMHITIIRGIIANMPAAIAETNTVTGFNIQRKLFIGKSNLFRNRLNDGIYTSMPSVAEKDIQNAPSSTAPGETVRIITPARERDVKESAAQPKRIDKYTNKSISTDLVADIEKPVIAR